MKRSPTTVAASLTALAAAVIALPLREAAAQTPQAAPPANPIATSFRNRSMTMHRNLAQAFDSIPESRFSFKPTPAQLTIGFIAQHLANDNYFFCGGFGPQPASRSAEETSTPDSIKATWPKARLVEQLKASTAFCEAAFAQLDDAKVGATVPLSAPDGSTRQVPRVNLLLGHALDLADHYSQIANYMRLNGMLPPTALPRRP